MVDSARVDADARYSDFDVIRSKILRLKINNIRFEMYSCLLRMNVPDKNFAKMIFKKTSKNEVLKSNPKSFAKTV